MPSLQNLEKFKRELASYGDEPEILKARGERPEELAPPAESPAPPRPTAPSPGLADSPRAPRRTVEVERGGAQPGLVDVDNPAQPREEGQPESDFFLDDFLKAEESAEESELTSVPGLVDLEGGEPPPGEAEGESSGVGDGFDLEGLDEPESPVLPEEAAEAGGAELEAPPSVEKAPDTSDDDLFFTIPSFDAPGPGAPAAPSESSGEEAFEPEEPPPDSFDSAELGDLGGIGVEEPSPGAEVERVELPPDLGAFEPPGDLGVAEEPVVPEESFEMPEGISFDEPGPAGEEEAPAPPSEEATGASGEAPVQDEIEMPFETEAEAEESASVGDVEAPRQERRPQAAPSGGEDFELDEFNLGDIGEQFGASEPEEGAASSDEELNPALSVRGGEPSSGGVELSDRDFRALQATLARLPQNLRLAIEELIGEKGLSGTQLVELVDLLVGGASAKEIAALTGRITGVRIRVPAQYEKKTGLAFEEERDTFSYRFRRNILPVLRGFLLAAAAIALLVFLGYRFVYRPASAYLLYSAGYRELVNDRFVSANQLFDRGVRRWQIKNWYYRYAEGFAQKNQYAFAADKYDALLRSYPDDRKGIFDYADLESKVIGNYPKAEELVNRILSKNMYDYQGLLAAGDNYLAWGALDPSKYEEARRDYATILQKYGIKNEILFRMLRYFIRTNNYPGVESLEKRFQADKSLRVDPEAYAELGGYLISQNRLEDVRDILFRAKNVDSRLPEVHYNLARYFKRVGDFGEESVALENTLFYLRRSLPLTRERLGMLVDTFDRVGESHYRKKEYLDAEQAYLEGIRRYESALAQNQLQPSAQFGKLYSDLGDLNYYVSGDYDQALALYRTAETNLYTSTDLKYKEGYVNYRDGRYEPALLDFYNAAGTYSTNLNLMFATANTLFERHDLFAAQGYYNGVLDALELKRENRTDFAPSSNVQDRELLTDMMMTYNNLGVTLNLLGRQSEDSAKYSQALVNFTRSMEAFDQLSRDPLTMRGTQSVSLAALNTKEILFPLPGYELQIYADLPMDPQAPGFQSTAAP